VIRKFIFSALVSAAILSQLGCGGAAIGTLKSITLSSSPSTNLSGAGGIVQLSSTGNYSTGAHSDLSNKVTYTVTTTGTDDTGAALLAPPNTITISPTGLVTAVTPFVCTWIDTTPSGNATWSLSGSYQIVSSFKGISSQPVFISVASAVSNTNPAGKCGP
jgi:hypothetical protein